MIKVLIKNLYSHLKLAQVSPQLNLGLLIFIIIVFLIIFILVMVRYVFGKRKVSLRRKAIRVFISHAVDDFDSYRVAEIAKYLLKRKEISHVYYCEEDLSGNIDDWMRKTVPRCQLLIFISTERSLNSDDCINEINLARRHNIEITPVLGVDSKWEDLDKVNINRELGHEYKPMEFEKFCKDLYFYILKFKHDLEDEIAAAKRKK